MDNIIKKQKITFFQQTVLCELLTFVLCLKQMQQIWIMHSSFNESSVFPLGFFQAVGAGPFHPTGA